MTTKTTERDLVEEVEELLAKATPGPWSRSPAEPSIVQTAFAVVCDTAFGVNPPAWRIDNAELIAAAPELLRRLVDENKALRTQVTPKPQPKAGACVGRFAFRSDECTKCGLSRKDHE